MKALFMLLAGILTGIVMGYFLFVVIYSIYNLKNLPRKFDNDGNRLTTYLHLIMGLFALVASVVLISITIMHSKGGL